MGIKYNLTRSSNKLKIGKKMKQNFSLIAIALMLTFFISCNESKKNDNKNIENGKSINN